MFRLEDNVPGVYVEESRDFQLLCRIIDIYLCGEIEKARSMIYQLDINNCNENLLCAIANMQAFTTNNYFPPEVLRNICSVFPYCIKRKGTADAIRVASLAVLSVDRLITDIKVELIKDTSAGNIPSDSVEYSVYITCRSPGVYRSNYLQYLDEVLRFLVPTGWNIRYTILGRSTTNIKEYKSFVGKAYTLGGITGKIIGSQVSGADSYMYVPYTPTWEKGITGSNKTGISVLENTMYSRVGSVKIISSNNSVNLLNQTQFDENLIDKDSGKTNFIEETVV